MASLSTECIFVSITDSAHIAHHSTIRSQSPVCGPREAIVSTSNLINGLNTLTTFSLSSSAVPNRWKDLAAMDRLPAPVGLALWSKVQLLNTETPSTQALYSLRWKLISPLCWSSLRCLLWNSYTVPN